jgi:hypothetical protein
VWRKIVKKAKTSSKLGRLHYMKCPNIASMASIVLALVGLTVGLKAAYYWWKASKIEIDPGWNSGSSGDMRPTEPADLEGMGSLVGWVTATMAAVTASSDLNRKAAIWTAAAVMLGGVSGVVGAFAGCLQ